MFSALSEPPRDSGVNRSADAPAASARAPRRDAAKARAKTRRRLRERSLAKAARILFMGRSSASPPMQGINRTISFAAKSGVALLQKRGDALGEIGRGGHLLLDLCLELELGGQARVGPLVELALGA